MSLFGIGGKSSKWMSCVYRFIQSLVVIDAFTLSSEVDELDKTFFALRRCFWYDVSSVCPRCITDLSTSFFAAK